MYARLLDKYVKQKKNWISKKESYPFWVKAPLILFGLCLLVLIMSYGKFIFKPLAFAALISMLLSPVIKRFESWRMNRAMSILLALSIVFISLSVFITFITIQIIQFSDTLPDVADKFKSTSFVGMHYI